MKPMEEWIEQFCQPGFVIQDFVKQVQIDTLKHALNVAENVARPDYDYVGEDIEWAIKTEINKLENETNSRKQKDN